MTCGDCRFWRTWASWDAEGITWAPCGLKPTKWVPDRRLPGGFAEQSYVMASDFSCPRFEQRGAR